MLYNQRSMKKTTRTFFCFMLFLPFLMVSPLAYSQSGSALQGLGASPEEDGDLLPTPENVALESSRQMFTETEVQLLQELDVRRIELDRREQALRVRERLVGLAEQEVETRLDKMVNLQEELNALMESLSQKEEGELMQLAKIYEEMRAGNAAVVLDKIDDKIVFDLFKRMDRKSTAKIMGSMSPAKARRVSQMLAEKADLPEF